MKLILFGLARDRKRLEELAARISGVGHEARFQAFSKDDHGSDEPVDSAEISESPIILHCWTKRSVGREGRAFQADAVAAKEQGNYRGLICDEVEIPKPVADAVDFRLPQGEEAVNDQAIRDLVRAMEARLETRGAGLGVIRRQLDTIVRLAKANYRLTWTAISTATVVLLAGIGLLADGKSLFDWAGEQPTAEQEQQWRAIVGKDSCDAFETYIARHGLDAPYAADARYRISQAREVEADTVSDPIQIGFAIPLADTPLPRLSAAQDDVHARAPGLAEAACKPAIASLGGTGIAPTIMSIAAPDCVRLDGGHVCRGSGIVECPTARKTMRRVCAPAGSR